MPARQRGRGVKALDDHAPCLFDIEAGLPGRRQILEAAGDQNKGPRAKHVGKLKPAAKGVFSSKQACDAE